MKTTHYKNSKYLYEEITQQIFRKNIMYIYHRIGKTNASYALRIPGYIGLLFLFSIRIHIPQDFISSTTDSIRYISQESIMKNSFNISMVNPIPDFGYELKGNSYSYPLPFFE